MKDTTSRTGPNGSSKTSRVGSPAYNGRRLVTKTEVAKLLTMISAIDNRTVGTETVEAWFLIVADLDFDECVKVAFEHFGTTTDYLVPAHIKQGVAKFRKAEQRIISDLRLEYTSRFYEGEDQQAILAEPEFAPLVAFFEAERERKRKEEFRNRQLQGESRKSLLALPEFKDITVD